MCAVNKEHMAEISFVFTFAMYFGFCFNALVLEFILYLTLKHCIGRINDKMEKWNLLCEFVDFGIICFMIYFSCASIFIYRFVSFCITMMRYIFDKKCGQSGYCIWKKKIFRTFYGSVYNFFLIIIFLFVFLLWTKAPLNFD